MSVLRRRNNPAINPNAASKTSSQEDAFQDKIERIKQTLEKFARDHSAGLASVVPSIQELAETIDGTNKLVVSNFPATDIQDIRNILPSDVTIGLGKEWTITVPSPVVRSYKTTDWLLIFLAVAVVCLVIIVKITGFWEPRL